jgi:hypothetical protein
MPSLTGGTEKWEDRFFLKRKVGGGRSLLEVEDLFKMPNTSCDWEYPVKLLEALKMARIYEHESLNPLLISTKSSIEPI